jgi:[acyl-carrier-protein] S-malonyltransferase
VTIANDNAPGQIVISGDKAAVDAAIAAIKEMGVRKAMLLPVSAPFHCPLMQPAADAMADALKDAQISNPSVPVVTNVSAQDRCRTPDPARPAGRAGHRQGALARKRRLDACLAWSALPRRAPKCSPPCSSGISRRRRASLVTAEDLEAFAASLKG